MLAVAGSASYRGAAALAVEGALRAGAGIVTLASVEPVLAAVAARLPECCLCPCEAGAEGGISPQNIDRIRRQKASVLLAGMTSALLACGLPAFDAAACAVYLHGAAADRAAALHGETGMLPHDLLDALGTLFAENGR